MLPLPQLAKKIMNRVDVSFVDMKTMKQSKRRVVNTQRSTISKRSVSSKQRNLKGVENKVDLTEEELRRKQEVEKQEKQKDYAQKAFEQEKLKQRLREISKKVRLEYAQVKALYFHFSHDIEPTKAMNAMEESAFPLDEADFRGREKREEMLEKLKTCAIEFEQAFFPSGHAFPYDGNAQKLNRDADSLEFEEYVDALVYLARHGKPEDRLLFLFQLVDRDGDGQINHIELMELLSNHCTIQGKEEALYTWVKKHFREADVDKSGTLDYYECLGILKKHPMILQQIGFDINSLLETFSENREKLKALKRRTQ